MLVNEAAKSDLNIEKNDEQSLALKDACLTSSKIDFVTFSGLSGFKNSSSQRHNIAYPSAKTDIPDGEALHC